MLNKFSFTLETLDKLSFNKKLEITSQITTIMENLAKIDISHGHLTPFNILE